MKKTKITMIKKLLAVLCLCIAALMIVTSCGEGAASSNATDANGKPQNDSSNGGSQNGTGGASSGERPEIDYSSDPTMDGIDTSFVKNFAEMFTERDQSAEFDESKCAVVEFNGTEIKTESSAVSVSGNKVMLLEEGTYILRGQALDAMVIVNADKKAKVQIVFDGVDITSATSAPIYVQEADKVFVTLNAGTSNYLANGGSFVAIDDNNIDSAIFSKQDLTLNGSGTLSVKSPAGHGIVSKDDLVITGGEYNVTAAGHALDANDSVRIANATFNIEAGKDGIHADNNVDASLGFIYLDSGVYTIKAKGDGISSSSDIQINDGSFNIKAGEGTRPSDDPDAASMKGIRAKGNLLVNDGEIEIEAADDSFNVKKNTVLVAGSFKLTTGDDAIHSDGILYSVKAEITVTGCREGLEASTIELRGGKANIFARNDAINVAGGIDGTGDSFSASNGKLLISGGDYVIKAGGDGIDVNGAFEMSGGTVLISVSAEEGSEAFDYEGEGVISGGLFIAAGSSELVAIPTADGQGIISVNAGAQAAGTAVTVYDKDGKTALITATPELDFEVVIISGPELTKGETYSVVVGELSGSFVAK